MVPFGSCGEVVSLYGGRILGVWFGKREELRGSGEINKFGLNFEKAPGKENFSCLFDFYIFLLSIQVYAPETKPL